MIDLAFRLSLLAALASIAVAGFAISYEILKGFKMQKILKKYDIDEFEVIIFGLIAVSYLSIVVEMYVRMFR